MKHMYCNLSLCHYMYLYRWFVIWLRAFTFHVESILSVSIVKHSGTFSHTKMLRWVATMSDRNNFTTTCLITGLYQYKLWFMYCMCGWYFWRINHWIAGCFRGKVCTEGIWKLNAHKYLSWWNFKPIRVSC